MPFGQTQKKKLVETQVESDKPLKHPTLQYSNLHRTDDDILMAS